MIIAVACIDHSCVSRIWARLVKPVVSFLLKICVFIYSTIKCFRAVNIRF